MMHLFYKLVGHEVVPCESVVEWGEWMENADNRVKLTDIEKGVYVSTVFLGLSLGLGLSGMPNLLFETAVIGGVKHMTLKRWSTWDEAEKGHDDIVEEVRRNYTYIMKRG